MSGGASIVAVASYAFMAPNRTVRRAPDGRPVLCTGSRIVTYARGDARAPARPRDRRRGGRSAPAPRRSTRSSSRPTPARGSGTRRRGSRSRSTRRPAGCTSCGTPGAASAASGCRRRSDARTTTEALADAWTSCRSRAAARRSPTGRSAPVSSGVTCSSPTSIATRTCSSSARDHPACAGLRGPGARGGARPDHALVRSSRRAPAADAIAVRYPSTERSTRAPSRTSGWCGRSRRWAADAVRAGRRRGRPTAAWAPPRPATTPSRRSRCGRACRRRGAAVCAVPLDGVAPTDATVDAAQLSRGVPGRLLPAAQALLEALARRSTPRCAALLRARSRSRSGSVAWACCCQAIRSLSRRARRRARRTSR